MWILKQLIRLLAIGSFLYGAIFLDFKAIVLFVACVGVLGLMKTRGEGA